MSSYSNDGKTPVPQVLAQTWITKIPVHLSLAPDNISSPSAVRPVYLMAPRQGYLNVVASQAWPHLQHVLPSVPGRPGPPKPWLDCRGVPLRWQLPCGVLYDILTEQRQLPWRLTVHYTHPPDALAPWEAGATPQALFLNSLKEACYICRGTDGSGAVMRMGSSAQDELWAAVQAGDVAAYRTAMEGLRTLPTSRQGQSPNIPVRLFLRRAAPAASPSTPNRPSAPTAATAATSSTTPATPPSASVSTPTAAGAASRGSAGGAPASASATNTNTPVASGGNILANSILGGGTGGGGGTWWESYITGTSRPIPAQRGGLGGEPTTLAHLLHIVLPHIFPPPAVSLSVAAVALHGQGNVSSCSAGGGGGSGEPPAAVGLRAPTPTAAATVVPVASSSGANNNGGGGGNGSGSGGPEVGKDAAVGSPRRVAGGGSEAAGRGPGTGAGRRTDGAAAAGGATSCYDGPGGSASTAGAGARGGSDVCTTGPHSDRPLAVASGSGVTGGGADDGDAGGEEGLVRGEGGGLGPLGSSSMPLLQPAGSSTTVVTDADEVTSSAAAGTTERVNAAAAEGREGNEGGGTTAPVSDPGAAAVHSGDTAAAAAVPTGPSRWPACRVLVGGISPPLEAPVAWLHAALHAPDFFLYVVVRMDEEEWGGDGEGAGGRVVQ